MNEPADPVPQDFSGKVALVTGATRGIGLAIAAELVARGARVTITARKQDEIDAALDRLGGEVALGVRGSADDETHQGDAVSRTVERFGSLDLLVNNAAVSPYLGPFMGADVPVFAKILAVNVLAPFAWTQRAYLAWMQLHGGAVLNISSTAGLKTGNQMNLYGVSKAALLHMTKQLAAELGPGIRVNAIAPALVKTKFSEQIYLRDEQGAAAKYPLKRLGTTQDIAKLAAFLLGPDATWITGQVVAVDGGSLAAGV